MSVGTSVRILLVEDVPADAELIVRELRREGLAFTSQRVFDRASYIDALSERPDLVLSDFALPQFDGLSALTLLKERHPDVPFILISGAIGEDLAVAAMREGAADYLLKDRLSRLPTAVTAALNQARLRRERRQLEERLLRADRLESLGRLSAGIAHDLNNILLPIMMAEQLLRDIVDEARALELLDTIESSAVRGAKVLKQLLTFGRGTSGERIPIQLASVVGEMQAMMRETFPKSVTVEVRIDAAGVLVLGDPTQLHQVLMNLCVNARDAMPNGGTLTLSLDQCEVDAPTASRYPGSEPGRYCVLSVKDTGVGIAGEHLSNIFEPFFTTKELERGTGLGLWSVLGIVESHGGFIQVESAPNAGAEFKLHLRVHEMGAEPTTPRRAASAERVGKGQLLLLVDDEAPILQVLGATAGRFGYNVLEANDGVAALAAFSAANAGVAVVVTDLGMPRLDGLGLIREIRALGSKVPVVVMTGDISSEQIADCRALGVDEFLRKPFRVDDLLQSLARATSETR